MSDDKGSISLRERSGLLAFADSFDFIHVELREDRIVFTANDDRGWRGLLTIPLSAFDPVRKSVLVALLERASVARAGAATN